MGYAISRHRELLRLICSGTNQRVAGRVVGMSYPGAQRVWSRYGGPPSKGGQGDGIATLAYFDKPGGPSLPLSYAEWVVTMVGLDFGTTHADIDRKIETRVLFLRLMIIVRFSRLRGKWPLTRQRQYAVEPMPFIGQWSRDYRTEKVTRRTPVGGPRQRRDAYFRRATAVIEAVQ